MTNDARDSAAVREAATALLVAYARKDVAEVMAHVDSARVVMFGTDSAEAHRGGSAVVRQMRDDFVLWDSSSFAPIRNMSTERSGNLATAFFEAPWTAYRGGHAGRYLLRFATTWRQTTDGRWRLLQLMNSVASAGQSAAELRRH